jgi:hypothetical protein
VRYTPYMSPSDCDQVLRDHEAQRLTSQRHAILAVRLAEISSRGRKRVHRNLLTFEGKVDRTAVLGVMANWLFNYNTVRVRGVKMGSTCSRCDALSSCPCVPQLDLLYSDSTRQPPVHRILQRLYSPQCLRHSTPARHPPVTPLILRVRPAPRATSQRGVGAKWSRVPPLNPPSDLAVRPTCASNTSQNQALV